jgi:putative transposase
MAHTFTHLLTHIIFSAKDRAPLLNAELKSRLFPYLGGIIRAHDGKALIINGPADHVHMLASLAAKHAWSGLKPRAIIARASGAKTAASWQKQSEPPSLCVSAPLRLCVKKP